MKLLFLHVFMWREAEDAIRVVAETLGLIQSQELEECAFVLFELHFELDASCCAVFEWLYAGVVLPDETLEFG